MKGMDHFSPVVERVRTMVSDRQLRALCKHHGLDIADICWDDSVRSDSPATGPNLSQLAIQVQYKPPGDRVHRLATLPVIRPAHFHHAAAEVAPEALSVWVGNQRGEPLQRVTLGALLDDLRRYLHDPDSWAGPGHSLLAAGDHRVQVNAQASFLPVTRDVQTAFNPVLFNAPAFADDPAVLAIVCTHEGCSATVVDNHRDAYHEGKVWGQRLFFNAAGRRAMLVGRRNGEPSADGPWRALLVVQVPLRQKHSPERLAELSAAADGRPVADGGGEPCAVEGPFVEVAHLPIERDERYPIRVTVQFYKATYSGMANDCDIRDIAQQLQRVYKQPDYAAHLLFAGPGGQPAERETGATAVAATNG